MARIEPIQCGNCGWASEPYRVAGDGGTLVSVVECHVDPPAAVVIDRAVKQHHPVVAVNHVSCRHWKCGAGAELVVRIRKGAEIAHDQPNNSGSGGGGPRVIAVSNAGGP